MNRRLAPLVMTIAACFVAIVGAALYQAVTGESMFLALYALARDLFVGIGSSIKLPVN